jgi:hypothetical protein
MVHPHQRGLALALALAATAHRCKQLLIKNCIHSQRRNTYSSRRAHVREFHVHNGWLCCNRKSRK